MHFWDIQSDRKDKLSKAWKNDLIEKKSSFTSEEYIRTWGILLPQERDHPI